MRWRAGWVGAVALAVGACAAPSGGRGAEVVGASTPALAATVEDAGRITKEGDAWGAEFVTAGQVTIAVLELRRFGVEDPQTAGFESTLRALADAHALVLDLRGATGADEARAERLLAMVTGAKYPVAIVSDHDCGPACARIRATPVTARVRGFDGFEAATRWLFVQVPTAGAIAAPAAFIVAADRRAAEVNRLRTLGVDVADTGPVLERPWAEPYTRRSFVVPVGWLLRPMPHRVYAPALLADLDVLETAMSRAYGGWASAVTRGWKWDAWFADWRRTLRTAGPRWLPTATAFAPVERFERFQIDNHTTIPLGSHYGATSETRLLDAAVLAQTCDRLRDRSGAELPVAADPARAPRSARRFDGESLSAVSFLAYPSHRSDIVAVHCGDAWIGLHAPAVPAPEARATILQELSGLPTDKPHVGHLRDDVAYLRLPTFTKTNTEIIARERPSWDKPNGHERALVVDLRGNTGGDAATDAIRDFVDAAELDPRIEQRLGASCLFPALSWGYANLTASPLRPPLTEEMQKRLSFSVAKLDASDDPACPPRWTDQAVSRHYHDGKSGRPRKGKPLVIVVVDGQCASDCEGMTAMLAKLPETVVAGVNTAGVAQYIRPGYSTLPNTRLPFRIALGTSNLYGDARSFDGYGLDVDIVLDGTLPWKREGLLRLADVLAAEAW